MPDLSERLAEAVGEPDPWFGPRDIEETVRRRDRRRGIGVRVVAITAVLALLGGAAVLVRDDDQDTTVSAGSRNGADGTENEDPAWTVMADAPLSPRTDDARVWAGGRLFVWSGAALTISTTEGQESFRSGRVLNDGATYDPVANQWELLPEAPIAGRQGAAAVWTGREVLVWGGANASDGAAYDPAMRTWRVLPPAPIPDRAPLAAVWTGTALLVWGDTSRADPLRDGATFDPVEGRWRKITDAPVALNEGTGVWTGTELVVVASRLVEDVESASTMVLAYTPAVDAWRPMPPVDLSPQAPFAAWDGSVVIAWDYLLEVRRLDPAESRWTSGPAIPLQMRECYPDGASLSGHVVVNYCGQAADLDTDTMRWQRLQHELPQVATAVSTGQEIILWGVAPDAPAALGVIYRPPVSAGVRRIDEGALCFQVERQGALRAADQTDPKAIDELVSELPSSRRVDAALFYFPYGGDVPEGVSTSGRAAEAAGRRLYALYADVCGYGGP